MFSLFVHSLVLQHFSEWSDSASVLVLGSSCYQLFPFHVAVHGERVLLLKAKDALCVHFSLDRLNAATKSPLCQCVKASICVSLHFCHRMCTKCWLTAFWVTAPPPFPQERFVARLIYPLWHTGISFPAMSIYPEGDGGSYRCPIWTCRVTIPGIKGGNIKFWGERGKKAARLCVMEMLAWYLPIAISQCPQMPLQKAIAALQLRVKGQNSLCAPASADGTLGSQQCTVNYMVFVWRAGLIQVRAWMCVYSWADWSRKFCSISIASYCSFIVLLVFIIELWKSCKWIMSLVMKDTRVCPLILLYWQLMFYMYISLISRMRIFKNTAAH